ncbi:MAG: glucosidase [Cyanobacteriota bacterium]|nr:glucosidase [Cyanobacteriota bacterium]
MTPEHQRLEDSRTGKTLWKKWGPYLSERQWGTVREDYSADGSAWDYFSHDQSRSRAYRWGEDGLGGISDNRQLLCFAIALWNGNDPILKERLFGLTGNQGNHGEDVKEYYFYLDSTPTHSYVKFLYKYPHAAYPYSQLIEENQRRGRNEFEYELLDTGIFNDNRYFDVFVEYAKASPEDIAIRISVVNRGPETATLHLLPTLWFRNTWSWDNRSEKPSLKARSFDASGAIIETSHPDLGQHWLYCDGDVPLLFVENETNNQRLYGAENASAYVKDGINDYVVGGKKAAVNGDRVGTKCSPYYTLTLGAGETQTVKLRLCDRPDLTQPLGEECDRLFSARQKEADEFYRRVAPFEMSEELRNIQRQAFAGLLWTKQYYHYDVAQWLQGDPAMPPPPPQRKKGRNCKWSHFESINVLSMPDKWEYPWFAAWDLAFHCIPLAMVDPEFAKNQLDLMTREWYMHPNGQIPAYEWKFGDVNPPVHAWATWRVYKIEQKMWGRSDRAFLERIFQKLLLNFTWWVNRKDTEGSNVFEGGFLGLDNIGVFDRSAPLPTGGFLQQADGTSWMGMYCLNLLSIALELAIENPVYEDMATKFFEHFIYIADAINHIGGDGDRLWDEEDGFFYDVARLPNNERLQLKVRSMVGLIPLFAVVTLEPTLINQLPNFKRRLEWFIKNRPELRDNVACMESEGLGARRLLAIVQRDKLPRILTRLLDEAEFFSNYGIRSLSRYHREHPYILKIDGNSYRVDYEPAESSTALFGGNSNWRGPVWFPVNFLLIESLQKFHHYLGDDYKVECPKGSGKMMSLWEVASEIEARLISAFVRDESGNRPIYGDSTTFETDPHWKDYFLFHEYFHGDNGAGLGASHQTGWTGLVAKLIQQRSEYS